MIERFSDHWDTGIYRCSLCGNPLFASEQKFKSVSRWPTFRKALPDSTVLRPNAMTTFDGSEILCRKCGQHIGYYFEDGRETGDIHPEAGCRYCVVSDSLIFTPSKEKHEEPAVAR